MAESLETYDLTDPTQHGWAVDHRIRRADGEELHAEVRCWDQARESAERAGNADALQAMADHGLTAPRLNTRKSSTRPRSGRPS